MLYGRITTIIQTSLDQSMNVQMQETEDKRQPVYYNKRPAGEKKGAEATERSASLLSRGASRAASSRIG
jgi:hypothetical protein